jgi:hypothetical protein
MTCSGRPPAPTASETLVTETKTKPTEASVEAYLASRASAAQLEDCRIIMDICGRVTGEPPTMWGPSIVGFGSHTYKYDSGHSGDACDTGFAVRRQGNRHLPDGGRVATSGAAGQAGQAQDDQGMPVLQTAGRSRCCSP